MIEKLGITPGPWAWETSTENDHIGSVIVRSPDGRTYYKTEADIADARLMAAAPEMFVWIYGMTKCARNNDTAGAAWLILLGDELLEKATGKTWEEVRGLIDG